MFLEFWILDQFLSVLLRSAALAHLAPLRVSCKGTPTGIQHKVVLGKRASRFRKVTISVWFCWIGHIPKSASTTYLLANMITIGSVFSVSVSSLSNDNERPCRIRLVLEIFLAACVSTHVSRLECSMIAIALLARAT